MTPTFSVGRGGKRYRYYVSASLQTGGKGAAGGTKRRIPGPDLDRLVEDLTVRLTSAHEAVLSSVTAKDAGLELSFQRPSDTDPTEWEYLLGKVRERLRDGERAWSGRGNALIVQTPVSLVFRGGRTWVEGHQPRSLIRPDAALVSALRRAHGIASTIGLPLAGLPPRAAQAVNSTYERTLVSLALLAPDIQQAILEGRHPRSLTLSVLQSSGVPASWSDQRRAFGFPPL
ncbi:hypothetical protein [Qipengyuania mesophila]|uniref:hypothetical protein n=1 Tax=Alphaproteobacteria TaxID=28211 RepID=UPI0035197894